MPKMRRETQFSMKPDVYDAEKYSEHFELYRKVSPLTLGLCPLTLGKYLKDPRIRQADHIACFFASQYCFNLIAQAVHSYFPQSSVHTLRYLNVQGCASHSFRGGEYSRPIDLISYLEGHQIYVSVEMLNEYAEYFLEKTLKDHFPEISIFDFSSLLLADGDCIEVRPCLLKMINKGIEQ